MGVEMLTETRLGLWALQDQKGDTHQCVEGQEVHTLPRLDPRLALPVVRLDLPE